MRERAISAAIFVPVLVIALLLGGPWLAALILVATGIAAFEAMRLLRTAGYPVLVGLGVVLALAIVADAAVPVELTGSAAILIAVAVILAAVGAFSRLDPKEGQATWVATVFGGVYVGMLGFILRLGHGAPAVHAGAPLAGTLDGARAWVIVLVLAVWAYDTGAYLVGKTFGERFGQRTGIDPVPDPPLAVEDVRGSVRWPGCRDDRAGHRDVGGRRPRLARAVRRPDPRARRAGRRPRRVDAQAGRRDEGLEPAHPRPRRGPRPGRFVPVRGPGPDPLRPDFPAVNRAEPIAAPIRVALLGSGGSIGRQAVDVLVGLGDAVRVVALATGRQAQLLETQARLVRPAVVALPADPAAATRLDLPAGTAVETAPDALVRLATRDDVDLVVVATGGIVSLRPVLAALEAGKVVATANKETLVAGGHLVMPLARRRAAAVGASAPTDPRTSPLAWLRPIDSEHSAIWQSLAGESRAAVARLILTASGGPFLEATPEELAAVTPAEALRHPTWTMGAKITIDSATLANKGLEVVEAHWLYDVEYDAIDVVIHPQSVVHSAVLFVDGSLKAQLGTPDMRLPIQYAVTYPTRHPSPAAPPDLVSTARLDFRAPDETRFPALRIAREAGRIGSRATTALIAADEVAVRRFLDGSLDFPGIARTLADAVGRFGGGADQAPGVEELIALDAEVRAAYGPGIAV